MKRGRGEIGLPGRLAIMFIGVMLIGMFWSDSVIGKVAGVLGVVLFASAFGLVELAMAVWYRTRRARSSPG